MSKNNKKYIETIETWIGAGTVVKGDISSDKSVRVDGKLIGNIEKSEGIVIGEKAEIKGNINTKYIVVAGKVEGDIVSQEGIELLDKSYVSGNIQTSVLSINEGAFFEGSSSMIKKDETQSEKAEVNSADSKNTVQKK